MSEFTYNEETYPIPAGWENLSMDDWFMKMEETRGAIMNAAQEDLPTMTNDDGETLDPEQVKIIQLGFNSSTHFENFRNWGAAKWAQETGDDPTTLEFRMSGIAREKIQQQKIAAASGAGGMLAPVDGITLDQWAQTNAKILSGAKQDECLAELGIDAAKWDKVNTEWNTRMANDTTFTITTAYGNAFASSGQGAMGSFAQTAVTEGVGGDLSEEPISYEKYVELMVAQDAAARKGEDVTAVFEKFGLTVMDWSNISMFWSKKTQSDAMHYHQLFTEYTEKYEAQYGITNTTDTEKDIEF